MRTLAILGATGSIGTQTLDIARRYPDRIKVDCLVVHSSAEKLFELVREFRPSVAAMTKQPDSIPEDLHFCQWFFGEDCSSRALKAAKSQDALCAIVGIAGLDAVWTALDVCERVLLANKEALVTGGPLVTANAARLNKPLLPVDSEHSAIFQCLQARQGNPVRRLILTASGGALRTWDKARIAKATVDEVLAHPTWKMGRKITVDCATMLNKGLEIIEAYHLFGLPEDKIDAIVHPQSIIHSMIEFEDGATLAQMGYPDMRGPIGYALGYPERLPYGAKPLDFASLAQLTFEAPDTERFPCLNLARAALRDSDSAPIVLNGANEVAVDAFLNRYIPFGAIPAIIESALNICPTKQINNIDDVYETDAMARRAALDALGRFL
ncbi:MAG: 1-deoxy-D-xylulose-5-phosphate reductoisomerase [Clostridia bacterium]|nr:1-deoxy-D-xylulose-5-phosphate reductoisomerase [Clostridia bacterium]